VDKTISVTYQCLQPMHRDNSEPGRCQKQAGVKMRVNSPAFPLPDMRCLEHPDAPMEILDIHVEDTSLIVDPRQQPVAVKPS